MKEETKRLIDLGEGYVFVHTHSSQANVTAENKVELIKSIKDYYL